MNGKPLVCGRGLHKVYIDGERRLDVLRGVDIEISRGEFIAIIGASGSGKSTLLHIMGALDRPSEGTMELAGHALESLSDKALARIRREEVGFVYQFHHLLPEFTALENTMLPGMISKIPPGELSERATSLLEKVGLAERMDHRPSKLSGGEQQRVAIARALLNEPALLLADEPTGNLDAHTSGEVLDFLISVTRDSQRALVMVTHDLNIAARADRRFRLVEGQLSPD